MPVREGGPDEPSRLGELDLEAHLRDPRRRQSFVTPMFDLIAPRYDTFTRIFSFGMDAGWKASLIDEMVRGLPPQATILDLACGTGDLAFAIAERLPQARVLGIDASPEMISLARLRPEAARFPNVELTVGDMMRLDVADDSAHAVLAGYALRNVPDHRLALDEIRRVLAPGGRLGTLDFYLPERKLWRKLFLGYLKVAGDITGWAWHREPVVYGYIASSIRHFVTAGEFTRDLHARGLTPELTRMHLGGGIAMHIARASLPDPRSRPATVP